MELRGRVVGGGGSEEIKCAVREVARQIGDDLVGSEDCDLAKLIVVHGRRGAKGDVETGAVWRRTVVMEALG